MLQFINVSNPEQIKDLLKDYEPLNDTWLVSDLKSKQEIQQEALRKHSFYTDDAILKVVNERDHTVALKFFLVATSFKRRLPDDLRTKNSKDYHCKEEYYQ